MDKQLIKHWTKIATKYNSRPEDVEDIVQDAVIKYLTKKHTCTGDLKTWSGMVAKNCAINSHRYNARAAEYVEQGFDVSFTKKVENTLMYNVIYRYILRLPNKQKQCILLRLQDLTFKEIGSKLNITEHNAKATYRHGILKLREVV